MDTLTDITFTSSSWIIITVLAFIVADFVTGLLQAWINSCIQSHIMREGIGHKAIECAVMALAWVAQEALVFPPNLAWIDLRVFVAFYLCIMELTSILENINKAGIWVPKFLIRRLEAIKEDADEGYSVNKLGNNDDKKGTKS